MKDISIAGRLVGPEHPWFIIAEAGANHNRDMVLARELIDAAAEAGADAVKFQSYKAEYLYSKKTPDFNYLKGIAKQSTYDLLKSIELPREWHIELKEYCEKKGVIFFSSPFDHPAVDELARINTAANKIASFEIVDLELIDHCARTGKPVIISTGMATYEEMEEAVRTCRNAGNNDIILLQCSSLYPSPAHIVNLRAIERISSMFDVIAGHSDHTLGIHIPVAAVASGAKVIEKHYTLSRKMEGPDHPFAIEPHELKEMVRTIRETEAALGNGRKEGPTPEEAEMYEKARRSIIACRNIKKGQAITREDLIIKRPGYGIKPKFLENILGMKATRDIEAEEWVTWGCLKQPM